MPQLLLSEKLVPINCEYLFLFSSLKLTKSSIIAPGNGYTGGHAWTQDYTGNSPASSAVMYKIQDPINNTAFDIHEYLDVDFSGGHSLCNSSASTYLAPLTSWLKQYGFKAMITEFGASNGTQCASYVSEIIDYMADNPEYIGWTAWAAGPFWGTASPCCSDSKNWGSLEPGTLASDGSPGMYEGVWVKEIEPLVPKVLQRKGITSVNGGVLSANATVGKRWSSKRAPKNPLTQLY